MTKTIEITKISVVENIIKYEIHDNTGLHLLKNGIVEAWVEYHHTENFGFLLKDIPESILAVPATLYLMPITWFYEVDLIVPSIDKMLHDNLPMIYSAYSKIFGPFKDEWHGNLITKKIVENHLNNSHFENIVFFSGGVDAVHAGINNTGKKNILVSVPSIEDVKKVNKKDEIKDFLSVKSTLIQEFSVASGSDWIYITNNFQSDIFNDIYIQSELKNTFKLSSEAFMFNGWFGIKYLGNLLSTIPFAYALGIKTLIMGSTYEELDNIPAFNLDGAHPELSDSFKIADITFAEQEGLYTRRSLKVKNIIKWCHSQNKSLKLWVCFKDSTEQCGTCTKCIRTQLNILCTGETPKEWGFNSFNEKKFSKIIRSYHYYDKNPCWMWDIIDSIDDHTIYPYCNDMLHWLKKIGYEKYQRKALAFIQRPKILRFYRYPHYIKRVFQKICKNEK